MSSVKIDFQAGGVTEVLSAIETVDKALAKMLRGIGQSGKSVASALQHTAAAQAAQADQVAGAIKNVESGVTSHVRGEYKKREKAAQDYAAYLERVQLQTAKRSGAQISAQVEAERKAMLAAEALGQRWKTRSAKESAAGDKKSESATGYTDNLRRRQLFTEQRMEESARNYVENIRRRALAKQQSQLESAQKHVEDIKRRHFAKEQKDEENAAKAAAKSQKSAQDYALRMRLDHFREVQNQDEREARRIQLARKRLAETVGNTVGNSVRNGLSTVANVAGGLMALGGGFGIADAVSTEVRAQGLAKDIELRSGKAVTAGQIKTAAAASGTQFGYKTEDVLDLANEFVEKSGSGKEVLKIMPQLTELASASGASLHDIGTMAAKFQLMTKNSDQTMDLLRTLVGVGRIGAIDINDLGMYGGRISAAASQFGDKNAAAKFMMGVIQQAAATGGAVDAAEATTALERWTEALEKRRLDIKATTGVEIMDQSGKLLKDPRSIMLGILSKTAGNPGSLSNLFTNERERRMMRGYEMLYREAYVKAKDTNRATGEQADKAGLKAVMEAMDEYAKAALSKAQIEREAAERAKEIDRQIESTMNNFRAVIGEALLPQLVKLVPVVAGLVPQLAAFLEMLAKNPIRGIGALILAAVTKDISTALIGQGIGAVLQRLLFGTGAAGAAGSAIAAAAGRTVTAGEGAAGGVGAALGSRGLVGVIGGGGVAGIGAAIATGAMTASSASEGVSEGQKQLQGLYKDIRSIEVAFDKGEIGQEEADRRMAQVRAAISKAKDESSGMSTIGAAASALVSWAPSTSYYGNPRENISKYNAAATIVDNADDVGKALSQLREKILMVVNNTPTSPTVQGAPSIQFVSRPGQNQSRNPTRPLSSEDR